jgi:hypothetical protein
MEEGVGTACGRNAGECPIMRRNPSMFITDPIIDGKTCARHATRLLPLVWVTQKISNETVS